MQSRDDPSPPGFRKARKDAARPSRVRTGLRIAVVVAAAFILGAVLAVFGWALLTWRYLPLAADGRDPRAVSIAAACIRWILGPGFFCNAGGDFGGAGGTLLCAALVWGAVFAAGAALWMSLRRRSGGTDPG